MPADWPEYDGQNEQTETQAITIDPPAYDDNADHSKTREEIVVEQQWRDVAASGIAGQAPLSINRDSDYVTDDPYTTP